jgi:hypothetical protein
MVIFQAACFALVVVTILASATLGITATSGFAASCITVRTSGALGVCGAIRSLFADELDAIKAFSTIRMTTATCHTRALFTDLALSTIGIASTLDLRAFVVLAEPTTWTIVVDFAAWHTRFVATQ